MQLFKQVYRAFHEKKINHTEPLEVYFDILHDLLGQYCFAYGKHASLLGEEELNEVYRETSEYVQQRFQRQEIDIKEIHIENSEPVIEKFVSAFIFVFQRRMVKRIKRQNHWLDLLEELLEDFDKNGIEELDIDFAAKTDLQQRPGETFQKENVPQAGQAAVEFILEKLNTSIRDIIGEDVDKTQDMVNEIKVSQIKRMLKKERITNMKLLAEILLLDN